MGGLIDGLDLGWGRLTGADGRSRQKDWLEDWGGRTEGLALGLEGCFSTGGVDRKTGFRDGVL